MQDNVVYKCKICDFRLRELKSYDLANEVKAEHLKSVYASEPLTLTQLWVRTVKAFMDWHPCLKQ